MSVKSSSPPSGASLPALTLQFEQPQDGPAVDALIDRAFGPGRYTKVSERVREIAQFAPELSVVAWCEGRLMGCARMWRVRVGGQPVTFLGPFAVEQGERNAGFGARMIERACEAARAAGETHVLLVGDEPYFTRVGFSGALAEGVVMPAPVDQRRVLARDLTGAGEALAGLARVLRHVDEGRRRRASPQAGVTSPDSKVWRPR
jgi:predicted N-acetyltransferase YhbS